MEEGYGCDDVRLRVQMHCDDCTTKVKRYLRGFEGVYDVQSDGEFFLVIVNGKAVDPLAAKQRIERKSHRPVEFA